MVTEHSDDQGYRSGFRRGWGGGSKQPSLTEQTVCCQKSKLQLQNTTPACISLARLGSIHRPKLKAAPVTKLCKAFCVSKALWSLTNCLKWHHLRWELGHTLVAYKQRHKAHRNCLAATNRTGLVYAQRGWRGKLQARGWLGKTRQLQGRWWELDQACRWVGLSGVWGRRESPRASGR